MIQGMRDWIAKLNPADTGETVWQNYARQHSYSDEEVKAKEARSKEPKSRESRAVK